jgi:hypothetical protein
MISLGLIGTETELGLQCVFGKTYHIIIIHALELISIEIRKPKSKPLLITAWYRPPNSSHDLFQNFEQFLKQVDDENMEFILTVDLNCNFLETTTSQVTSKLFDVMDIFQLQQHIKTPTRITPTSSTTLP